MTGGVARRFRRFVGVALVAVVVSISTAYITVQYRDGVERTERLQEAEARLAAHEIVGEIEAVTSQLRQITILFSALGGPTDGELREAMHLLLVQSPAIAQLRLLDSDRRERLMVSRSEPDRSQAMTKESRAECASSLVPEDVCFSDPFIVADTEPHVSIYRRTAHGPANFVAADLNLRGIWEIVHRLRIGKSGRVSLAESGSLLIADADLSKMLSNVRIESRDIWRHVKSLKSALPFTTVEQKSGEGQYLVTLLKLTTPPWIVLAEQPLGDAMAPVYRVTAYSLIILGIGLAVSAALVNRLASRLTAPIVVLQRGVARFSAGDLDARVDVTTDDEVESLAREFNRMAAQLAGYTGDLEKKVAEKTRELALANEHKSQFLANVSHELRTPLNAIIGFSELLKSRDYGLLNDEQAGFVNDILVSGEHLLALIDDLLDLSKVEAGRMELEMTAFDVRALLERSLMFVRERAARGAIELQSNLDASLGSWVGDERRLRQAVVNLLTNAIKFTRRGGSVQLAARQTDGELRLSVSDTGIGIPDDYLPRLFEPFSRLRRADLSAGDAVEGTGLGLALTKRLVELHGGSISVESRVDVGSTFTVALPRPHE